MQMPISQEQINRLIDQWGHELSSLLFNTLSLPRDSDVGRDFIRLCNRRLQWNQLPDDLWLSISHCSTQHEFWCRLSHLNRQCASLVRRCTQASVPHKTCLHLNPSAVDTLETLLRFPGRLESLILGHPRVTTNQYSISARATELERCFAHLQHFESPAPSWPYSAAYLALWSCMPQLRVLKLTIQPNTREGFEDLKDEGGMYLHALKHLEELHICGSDMARGPYDDWLIEWVSLPQLRALHIHLHMFPHQYLTLAAINPRIHTLNVSTPMYDDNEALAELNLQRFTELRSLRLPSLRETLLTSEIHRDSLRQLDTLVIPNKYPRDYWMYAEQCEFTSRLRHLHLEVGCTPERMGDVRARLGQLIQLCFRLDTLELHFWRRRVDDDSSAPVEKEKDEVLNVPWKDGPQTSLVSSRLRHVSIMDHYYAGLPPQVVRDMVLLFQPCANLEEYYIRGFKKEMIVPWWTAAMTRCFLAHNRSEKGGVFEDSRARRRFFELVHHCKVA